MFSVLFWKQALERAVKSAAQALVLVLGASQFDWLHAGWGAVAVGAGSAFVLSVITSIVSAPFGDAGTPSLVAAPSSPQV